MLYKYIYLQMINKLGEERTVNSIYHLLQGKKSVQTIQDAHLFHLEPYFAIHKKLTKFDFSNQVKKLADNNYLNKHSQLHFTLTEKGKKWLNNNRDISEKVYLNGWSLHRIADSFFERLQMIIQIWTNAYQNNMKFIPVIEAYEIKNWAKQIYYLTKDKIERYLQEIYAELSLLLRHFDDDIATIFVKQLSSYRLAGATLEQLSVEFNMDIVEIHMQTQNMIHYILNQVEKDSETFPVLKLLSKQKKQDMHLNESTLKTRQMFDRGMTIDEIVGARGLKESTIQDHLIEIAYNEAQFPFEEFFSQAEFELVNKAIIEIQSYQLKKVKAYVKDSLSYFKIRLIIAKMHQNI